MAPPDPSSFARWGQRLFRPRDNGSTIRSVLFAGFSAVFALWLVSAYDLVQRVTTAEDHAADLLTELTEGEELLFTVRSQVFLSSVFARDAVLESRPQSAELSRAAAQSMRVQLEEALRNYEPRVDTPVEREHWNLLKTELQAYWHSVSPLVAEPAARQADGQAFLSSEVIPKRDMVVRISDDLRTLNRDALIQQREAVADLHRELRGRIWLTSGIAVTFGLVAAWVASHHAGRLELRIREQHVEEQQAKRELQRLSSELVQVQEHERRRIARDLHDEIGQALMTVKLDLGLIDRGGHLSGAPAQALADARSTTDLAIRTVRDLSQLLHPPMLDDFGLVVTLEAFVRRFSDRTGVRTDLQVDGARERLPPDVEVCAYRVIQEALTNVAKHAEATSCRVILERRPEGLRVTIEDDGKGMAPARLAAADATRGVGLVGVRERVSRLAGTVTMRTAHGSGTSLIVDLPLAAARSQDTGGPMKDAVSDPSPAGTQERL